MVYSNLDSISGCTYQTLKNETGYFSKIKILKTDKRRVFKLINSEKIKNIEVFSINGQKINSFFNDNYSEFFLTLEEYTSGLYFIIVYDSFLRKKIFKMVLE